MSFPGSAYHVGAADGGGGPLGRERVERLGVRHCEEEER